MIRNSILPAFRAFPAIALAVAFMGAPYAALAQKSDADLCAKVTNNPDLGIQHCTRAIESKKYSGDALSRLHYNRAVEYFTKGQYDNAIGDCDAAIRLDPNFSDAYYTRGNAWGMKLDADRAIADYDAAVRLNPRDKSALGSRAFELALKGQYARAAADQDAVIKLDPKTAIAWHGRGRLRFYTGDYKGAISDLQQAMALQSSSYTAFWLYLSRMRSGASADEANELLEQGTADIRGGGWPWQIVLLYVGRTDVSSVLAGATDQDRVRQREQRCEAAFYLGQWYVLQNDRARALPLLKEAQDGCPRDFIEHEGAVAELRRLQAR